MSADIWGCISSSSKEQENSIMKRTHLIIVKWGTKFVKHAVNGDTDNSGAGKIEKSIKPSSRFY